MVGPSLHISRPVTDVYAGVLDPRGPNADGAVDLWWLMLGLGTAVFVLFAVLLALGLRRRGADGVDTSAVPARSWLVGGGVVLPTVIVVVVLVATVLVMRDGSDPADVVTAADAPAGGPGGDAAAEAGDGDRPLIIEVTGHQFWWEVRYPALDITTANEIHIPAGVPVVLQLRAADVIHSFWVPALAGKMDLLPERANELVIEADEPGRYLGQCAEFCGLQHANMGVFVVADTPADFARWADGQRQDAARPTGEPAATGQRVFDSAGCAECHTVRGTAAGGTEGPDLTHLASRRTLAAGTLRLTTENLRDWVADPHDAKTGVSMPPTDLDDDELDALVAYLEGLR